MKVSFYIASFYSEYYLSILLIRSSILIYGETRTQNQWTMADFQENHYFQNRPFQF